MSLERIATSHVLVFSKSLPAAQRRVLALTFGPDFIHWRRSGKSWPRVWPGRWWFFLLNSPAAAAAQVRGRVAALGLVLQIHGPKAD